MSFSVFSQNPTVINDSLVVNQRLYAKEKLIVDLEAKFKQDIKVVGNARINTDLRVDGELRVDGLAKFMSNVKMEGLSALPAVDSTIKVIILQPNGQLKTVDLKTLVTGLAAVKEDPCNDLVTGNFPNPVWSSGLNKIFANYCGWVKVGIATSDPQFHLDVRGTSYSLRHLSGNSLASNNAVINGFSTNNSQDLFQLGVKVGALTETVRFKIANSGTVSLYNHGGHSLIAYANDGTKILQLENSGMLRAREIKVDEDNWPDYVFDKNYKLPSLTTVGEFINENHHLPGVPSQSEIESEGLNLGDMQKIQMQKIEELTLYLIEMEQKMKGMENRIIDLENENSELRNSN
ncbi:MAG: hypothetical protein JNJ99_02835 [Crocinitomicaceae bacterium]|nr:hypothetical protein [Crocinitomicaceae bacterium]